MKKMKIFLGILIIFLFTTNTQYILASDEKMMVKEWTIDFTNDTQYDINHMALVNDSNRKKLLEDLKKLTLYATYTVETKYYRKTDSAIKEINNTFIDVINAIKRESTCTKGLISLTPIAKKSPNGLFFGAGIISDVESEIKYIIRFKVYGK